MPDRVAVPLAIIIAILIFGLSRYYATLENNNDNNGRKVEITSTGIIDSNLTETKFKQNQQQRIHRNEGSKINDKNKNNAAFSALSNLLLVVGYAASLLIVTAYFFIFSPFNNEIFVPWEQFTVVQIIELGAAIALSFFLPGYALVSTLYRESYNQIKPLRRFLLAYLLSSLITGLIGYVAVSLGFGLEDTVELFIVVYLTILIVLFFRLSLIYHSRYELKYPFANLSFRTHTFALVTDRVRIFLRRKSAEFVVFASLFALIVLSTYSLYSGAIIGDQWYHHGRSLAFMSGEFIDISIAGADDKTFSPFPSSLLAAFFSVSGIPSVNAYASLGLLNIIPVFSFYYFFKMWVPNRMKRGALLASTLFMLSSGFGWVYVVDLGVTVPPQSRLAALQMLYQAGIKSVDIILPTSFIGTAHPDFSSPLIIMAMPAGFTILGLLREKIDKNGNKSKIKYFTILLSLAILGILSHDEFYLFIIIASIIPLFLFSTGLRDEKKKNFVLVYGALLVALLIVVLSGFSFARGYFIYNSVLGLPVIILCFIFVTVTSILYIATRFLYSLLIQKRDKNNQLLFRGLLSRLWRDKKNRTLAPGLVIIFTMAWLYAISFIVWSELSVEAVEIQTHDYSIPWYLYPVKLGVTGLLGLAFIISYLFKKFEKEIFVFGIIVVIAFVTGPYYDEHRFSKYIMAGLAGLGSLFIYSAIIKSLKPQRNIRFRVLATSLTFGIVILSSSLSILMFWGYNASALDSDFDKALGRRDFPLASEFGLFRLFRNDSKDLLAFNVAAPSDEYSFHTGDVIGKIQAFSGIPWAKLTQSPLSLNASTLEGFYDLLDYSDTRYIILPKEDFVNLTAVAKKDNEIETANGGKQEREQGQPQQDTVIREEVRKDKVSDVLHFAIENFQTVYEDSRHLVVAVPNLSHPRSQADIGFVFPRDGLLSSSLSSNQTEVVLPHNKEFFRDIENLTRSNKLEIGTTSSILYGDKEEITTFWSNPIRRGGDVNYIVATFRIIGENKTSNDAGILWVVGNKEYTLSVRNDRLEVLEGPTDVNNSGEALDKKLVNVREIDRMNGTWYTIKVILMEDYFDIYLNDIPAVRVPRINDEPYQPRNASTSDAFNADIEGTTSISRIGIFAYNNVAEFRPITIGQALLPLPNEENTDFHHYYPLNMLATSKLGYDTFMEGDPSVFSKEAVVLDINSFLPSNSVTSTASSTNLSSNIEDIKKDNQTNSRSRNSTSVDRYLEYAKKGGTLVITNAVDHYDLLHSTELGKLFPIQAGNEVRFEKLAFNTEGKENQQKQNVNISGIARDIAVTNSSLYSDTKVVSSYLNGNNVEVAPFAIEKKYGDGRVIVVNSHGLFSAIASSPQQYFQKLADVPSLIGLEYPSQDSEKNIHAQNAIPITRLVGALNVSGHSIINSSSFSIIPNNGSGGVNDFASNKFYVQGLVAHGFSDKSSKEWNFSHTAAKNRSMQDDNYSILDTVVKDLELSGPYEVIINLNGSFDLPANLPFASYYDYIAVSIQAGFDMIVRLQEGATAELTLENDSTHRQRPLSFRDAGEIYFNNVSLHDKNDISVLLKSPSIRVIDGKMHFEKLYTHDPNNLGKTTVNSASLNVSGAMIADINHVDYYDEVDSNGNWITTQYLTYIKSIQFAEGNLYNKSKNTNLDLPADISALAKEEGVTIPWQRALLSNTNIVISILIIVAAVALTLTILQRPWWLGPK